MSKHRGDGWDDEGNRRVAVLWVGEQDVFDASVTYLTDDAPPRYRLKLVADEVPFDDLSVIRVTHDPMRRAFGFLLHHETFAPVPEGCHAPDLERGAVSWKWVAVEPPVTEPFPEVPGYTKSVTLTDDHRAVVTYVESDRPTPNEVMVRSFRAATADLLAGTVWSEDAVREVFPGYVPTLPKNDDRDSDGPLIVEVK